MDKTRLQNIILEGARCHRKGLLKPGKFRKYDNYCSLKFVHITDKAIEHWIGYSDGFALAFTLLSEEPNRQASDLFNTYKGN